MRIIWLPLEPFECRYTQQWYEIFPRAFQELGVDYITVEGQALTSKIEIGSVLDAFSTSHWKMSQLANLVKLMRDEDVKSSDVILSADLWHPGIEALQYIACQGGVRPRITGILHAGTWDSFDFTVRTGMRPWGHQLEEAWFEIYDLVFVGSLYHKNLILKSHRVNPNKIVVTGLPFYPDELPRTGAPKDKNLVVFPHRLDPEKCPEEFDGLADLLSPQFPEVEWVKTAQVCQTKEQYYELLEKALISVSFSQQETFGIAMLESTALGCIPFVPDRLAYPEYYPKGLRYGNFSELVQLVSMVLGGGWTQFSGAARETAIKHCECLAGSIARMLNTLRSLKW